MNDLMSFLIAVVPFLIGSVVAAAIFRYVLNINQIINNQTSIIRILKQMIEEKSKPSP